MMAFLAQNIALLELQTFRRGTSPKIQSIIAQFCSTIYLFFPISNNVFPMIPMFLSK